MRYAADEENVMCIRVASAAAGSKAPAASSANVRRQKRGACPSESALLVKTLLDFKVRRISTPSVRDAAFATGPRVTVAANLGLRGLLVSA